jgi:hypothetical protein
MRAAEHTGDIGRDHGASGPILGNEARNASIDSAVMSVREPILRASSRPAPIRR